MKIRNVENNFTYSVPFQKILVDGCASCSPQRSSVAAIDHEATELNIFIAEIPGSRGFVVGPCVKHSPLALMNTEQKSFGSYLALKCLLDLQGSELRESGRCIFSETFFFFLSYFVALELCSVCPNEACE